MEGYTYIHITVHCVRYQAWGPNSETETKEFVNQVLQDASKVPRSRFSFALVELEYERVVGAGAITIRDFTNREGEIRV